METRHIGIFDTKPRYEILDGLRGVAALTVLLYHHFEVFGPGIKSFHGYLAVDFFFILSGFVIGYAYDDRWKSKSNPNGMTLKAFFKRRLIRLHPMLIAGTVIGMLLFYFGMGDAMPAIRDAHWKEMLLCFLFALFMIPVPHSLDVKGWGDFNPFNGNSWTLTFEYIANILYALVIRHFNNLMLFIFVVISALLTIGVGLGWNLFGVMDTRPDYQIGTFIGGWSLDPDQLVLGFSRLLFPFFAGLLMARLMCNRYTANGQNSGKRRTFILASLLLVAVLIVPYINGAANGIYEMLVILLMFPIIVGIGAIGNVKGKEQKICKWLGDISYPLYITHAPIVFTLCEGWKANHPDASSDQQIFVAVCSYILSILVAWAAFKLWDIPVRQWLKQNWLNKLKIQN